MIKTDKAYNTAVRRLKDDDAHLSAKREALVHEGLSDEQIDRVLEAEVSFHLQLREEVEWYDSVRRGDFQAVTNLQEVGRLLIALRIASGVSQRDLAAMLNVHESLVSRDERHEYYGITLQRAQEIIDALSGRIEIVLRPPTEGRELVGAGLS
uniref:HTH cro/C1-type domain-containing protein n=1 Tax=mine drainage metagenome TaxID=410659 RepID=E6Q7N0_9ZZZZ